MIIAILGITGAVQETEKMSKILQYGESSLNIIYLPDIQLFLFPFFHRYCETCVQADSTRIMTLKTPARKSSRKRAQRDYATLNSGLGSDANRWIRMLETKEIKEDPFKRFKGSDLEDWLEQDDDALQEPIVIERPEGLGMTMPPNTLSVEDVAQMVGEETPVEVIGERLSGSVALCLLLFYRRCFPVDVPRLGSGQMGNLL